MKEMITVHGMTPKEFKTFIKETFQEEFDQMNVELQRAMGEDDLVSTGTACRILGVCSKVLKALVDQRKFSVFNHIKEKRYKRSELLDYRNKYMTQRKRS